jgi:hypothetical protein
MNRDWVLFNLREAEEEIRRTIAEIEAVPDYGYGEFVVAMSHASSDLCRPGRRDRPRYV